MWNFKKFIDAYIDSNRSARAIIKADKLKRETKRRQYVLKLDKQYLVFNRSQINTLKRKGLLSKNLDFVMLDRIAYYKTL